MHLMQVSDYIISLLEKPVNRTMQDFIKVL
uniref:Uncharacterized protein n=1 Tax=Caudovirales sp. ctikv1 TaxID=2826781 RepID=A0A8S5N2L1_9CAUD|nr:MAG TPA: hypothetical protein [Caudovirales sp. ctikv1]